MKNFYLEILTPEKEFFKAEAKAVTFSTLDGLVTVLADHQPAVFGLEPGSLRICNDSGVWKESFLSAGFAQITPNGTVILAQAAEWPEDIDEAMALEAKEQAEELIRRKKSLMEYHIGKAALQRAFARLKVKSKNTRT